MANKEDPICKCNSTKIDANAKKTNGVKTKGWSKSNINKKNSKKDRQRFVGPIQV